MVSLNLIRFKLMSGHMCYVPGHCDLDLQPTDPNIKLDLLLVMATHDTKKDNARKYTKLYCVTLYPTL